MNDIFTNIVNCSQFIPRCLESFSTIKDNYEAAEKAKRESIIKAMFQFSYIRLSRIEDYQYMSNEEFIATTDKIMEDIKVVCKQYSSNNVLIISNENNEWVLDLRDVCEKFNDLKVLHEKKKCTLFERADFYFTLSELYINIKKVFDEEYKNLFKHKSKKRKEIRFVK